MTYHFEKTEENGLIIIPLEIDGTYEFKMLLDTGATHTTIDSNALYINNYDLKKQFRNG
jgi:predicted aspartyl protease